MKKLVIFSLSIFLLLSHSVFSQNPKKLIKQGKSLIKEGNYTEAQSVLTQAIDINNALSEAFSLRAQCFENLQKPREAANDYKMAFSLNPKVSLLAFNAGRCFYNEGLYNEAIDLLTKALELDKKNIDAFNYRALSYIKQNKYNDAISDCEKALELKKTAPLYYTHGIASIGINNKENAEMDFLKAIELDPRMEIAYHKLVEIQLILGRNDQALTNASKAVELFPSSRDAYLSRAKVYYKKNNLTSAINDLSNILATINSSDAEVFMLRGCYYTDFKQYQNAVTDFSKVLELTPDEAMAYYKRAICNEEIKNIAAATADYKSFISLVASNDEFSSLISKSKERIYELNRESDNPVIVITTPVQKNPDEIEVPISSKKLQLKGTIKDQSDIKTLKINEREFKFEPDALSKDFEAEFVLGDMEEINIVATDIYDNTTAAKYKILRTETNPPKIHLLNPYASDDGEMYLDKDEPSITIQGKITDESLIESIFIEDATASYKLDELNPAFTANVKILNKNSITIKVRDVYGNVKEERYTINREGAKAFADNPMGKTWVIFIENSKYESFASLDGPTKDVSIMKAALANYKINNIIHKKNMSKADMERFFAIELRDMVRENKVNSLVVWYAGHGKFIHETGYWIPIDAKRDDEFTYFNINSLRASMQSYAKFVTHTLVITDACESGPSFYMAMRSDPKERSCGDWTATRFKSSQVFTSAGTELASDNSKFSQTFANALNYNPNDCIPIDNIVVKVNEAMKTGQGQKPKFGKIAGLEDEDGTFFFIKNTTK